MTRRPTLLFALSLLGALAIIDGRPALVVAERTFIAQELEIGILAEGVETERQLALLRSIGCDAIHG